MPFITNDFYSRLVDDDEYVANAETYKDYVIARTLYVQWTDPFPGEDYLQRRFKKYGSIESTEVLRTGNEGYVTFTCDRYACLAYEIEKKKRVEVAYTWHQPTNQSETDQSIDTGEPSPLLQLNDDCLFAVFDLCDNATLVNLSETCTRFNGLLTGAYNFPANKVFDMYGSDDHVLSLAAVRKIVRLIGSHFRTLDLYLQDDADDNMIHRFLRIIMKYCGASKLIRELKVEVENWSNELSSLIEPILANLESLDLYVAGYSDSDVYAPDITVSCPNLKKLVTNICWEEYTRMTVPTLESYTFDSCSSCIFDSPDTVLFLAHNPQIKTFKCELLETQHLPSLAVTLPNVEKLSFSLEYISSSNDFQHLSEFKYLTKLKLNFAQSTDAVSNINLSETFEECFRRLDKLLELKLYFKRNNEQPPHEIQRSVTALPKMLPNLKRFDLFGFKLDEKTVVDFVRIATRLELLHLHRANVSATESLIAQLVAVRKSSHKGKLKLYLDCGSKDTGALNGADTQQFVNVKSGCSHDMAGV